LDVKQSERLVVNEILLAVDGSEHSLKVADYASELAKNLSSKILLVCVVNLPSAEPEGIVAFARTESYPDAFGEYLQRLSQEIAKKVSDRLEKSGVESHTITPSGNPAAEILQIAKTRDVKMIVIGLKGLHGMGRLRSLGSVARRVIEDSTRPVVVVP
jgi:nucleotide-binding universal stress UspA family protein